MEWRATHTARCSRPPRSLKWGIGSFAIGAKPGRSGGCREGFHDDGNHQRGLEPSDPALLERDTMTFSIRTHDSWGVVPVGDFQSIEEARQVFADLCQDPWYKADGTVKGVELVQASPAGEALRLDWFAFR